VSSIALPLTCALYLHASAAQMGYLTALIWAPSLLFSIPAGVWADQAGRLRAMMIGADLGRALLLGSVPACALLHLLSLPGLYVVVFVAGTLTELFEVCDVVLFTHLVPEARYVEGQSLMYGSQSMANLVGPSLGGALTALLSAPLAVAADAASYLYSAIAISSLPAPPRAEPATKSRRQQKSGRFDGLRFVAKSPVIRSALAVTAGVNLFNTMFKALLVLYLSRDLRFSPVYVGLVLSSAAAGGLAGVLLTAWIARTVGVGTTVLYGAALLSVPLLLVPLAHGSFALAVALVLIALVFSGAGRSMQNISVGSIFTAIVPRPVMSQAKGAYRMVSTGSQPLGALLGGALGTLAGVRAALLTAVIGGALSWIWMVWSPLRAFRLPCTEDELGATGAAR